MQILILLKFATVSFGKKYIYIYNRLLQKILVTMNNEK